MRQTNLLPTAAFDFSVWALLAAVLLAPCCAVNPVPTPETATMAAQGGGKTATTDAAAAADTGAVGADFFTGNAGTDSAAALDGSADAPEPANADAQETQPDDKADAAGASDSATVAGDGSGEVEDGSDVKAPPAALPVVPVDQAVPGVQYNGSVAYLRKVAPGLAWDTEFVEISAPIVPKTTVIYAKEGPNFPATVAEMAKLAHEAALTYDSLLQVCAPDYPGITLVPADAPKTLPADKLSANYDLCALCGYEKWFAKPYWIPKLVDKVDICGTELGGDWSLLSQADVASITAEQAIVITAALTPIASKKLGAFYFSTKVFIRSTDASIMTSSLTVGAAFKTIAESTPCPGCTPDPWIYHLEGGYGLRCIRVRGVEKPK